ncbi:hypothetical protein TNCT_166681 [Trichonephila clavata]|uniref:Reverse transcriptase domain-containing protein n=1 Tax=Trichonephila clavata TaxID=2740835 RepID=A0A8X6GBD5_TRICU|nr:hypothetical protein TNCT_166681 [Trichonephila clavata]
MVLGSRALSLISYPHFTPVLLARFVVVPVGLHLFQWRRGSARVILSGPFFLISLEQVLRPALEVDTEGYSLFYKPLHCLAYADDLILIVKSRESLQILLDSLVHTAAKIGLRFKPPKCASLAFHHARSTRVVNESISGTPIPPMTGPDAYKYLGLRVGLNFYHDNSRLFNTARDDILKVRDSFGPLAEVACYQVHHSAQA